MFSMTRDGNVDECFRVQQEYCYYCTKGNPWASVLSNDTHNRATCSSNGGAVGLLELIL